MKTANETIRKILSIALCLALVLSYVPILSFNASAAEIVITAGETLSVNGFDSVTLKFIPESDGEYTLRSDSSTDPYVTLYNGEMEYITDADDWDNGLDFCLTYSYTAGDVYYFVLGDYDNAIVNYSVILTKAHEHQGGEVTCKGKARDICGEYYGAGDPTKHQGGTPTCIGQDCELCYSYYGEDDENNHDLSGYATCRGEYCNLCEEYIKGEVDSSIHIWENGTCVCGAVCEDHIWEDGYCNICEAEHEHEEYDDDGEDYLGENKNFYSLGEVCTTEPIDASQATSLRNVRVASSGDCSYEKGFCIYCGSFEAPELNSENYYEISNEGQLYWFAEKVNSGETSINGTLTADIVVNPGYFDEDGNYIAEHTETVRIWNPVASSYELRFEGVFDGNNKTISGLYFNDSSVSNIGFIGYLGTKGIVKNLGIENSYFCGNMNVGAIVGISYGEISKCFNMADLKATYLVGGIAGTIAYSGTVNNCYNTGSVVAKYYYAGGIAGTLESTMSNCYSVGNISGDSHVGALTGELSSEINGTITDSFYLEGSAKDGSSVVQYSAGAKTAGDVQADSEGAVSKTKEQFASGEVAYLLQQGNTEQVWGQDSNQAGAKPMFDSTGLYKVVTVAETGNYSVANVGDTNGDGTVDVLDYQELVNAVLSDNHEQIETANYDDIVRYDLDGDGYLDVIDASLMHLFINGFRTIDVYAVGDYDLNGKAFEKTDILAMGEAMQNNKPLSTHQKYACDMNADGKVDYDDLNTLTSMFPHYFVGEE